LDAEIVERRNTARAHRESLRSTGALVTEAEWLDWFTDNSDAFRQRMYTAIAERSALSRRMRASPDIPKNAARLEASCAPPALSVESKPEWLKLLQGRDGWLCVRSNPRQVQTLFLCSRGYQTYFLSVDRFRRGQRFVVPGDVSAFRVAAAVHPLQSLVIDGDFDSCVELVSAAIAHDGHVSLGFSFAQRVAAPLPRSARTAPSAGATKELAAESDSDADSLAEELEADAAGDAKDGMSDSSGCFSVNTDVDVCVSEFLKRPDTDVDGVDASSDSDGAAAPSAEVAPSAGLTRPEGRHPPGTWTIWEIVWFLHHTEPNQVFGSQSPHEAALSVPAWLRHGLAEDVDEDIESPPLRRDAAEPSEDDLPFAQLGHMAGAVGWLGPRTRYSVAGDRAPTREAGP